MSVTVKKSRIFLFVVLLLAGTASLAMTMGRHSGAALVGRPLDISVQAVLDTQEELASLCLEADVFYADARQDKSRVRVVAEKSLASGRNAVIRILSSAVVDEPVVIIYLRAGCQQKTEKRYVVLADLVSEAAKPSAISQVPGSISGLAPSATVGDNSGKSSASPSQFNAARSANNGETAVVPAPGRSARRSQSGLADSAAQSVSVGALNPALALPAAVQRPADTARKGARTKHTSATEKNRARLKVEALDLTIERDPQLKSSGELLSIPASNALERSAAAALWRALTAQPQDILRDAEKLQTLENSVRNLQAQNRKNQLTIEDLSGQFKRAEAQRYANPLVYALSLLVLMAAIALGYLWRQRRLLDNPHGAELPWWRKNKALEAGWSEGVNPSDVHISRGDLGAGGRNVQATGKWVRSELDQDVNLETSDSGSKKGKHYSGNGGENLTSSISKTEHSDFGISLNYPAPAVKAEELFDVQQQADFFVSLGQHEQAIEVLRAHIGENVQTSVLVYLDLFDIYHHLNRRTDYEVLRKDFNQRFNAKIPLFELYTGNGTGPGLEAYELALNRIQALWPSPKVLDIIEESIFRRPDANAEAFDLEAYRELLLLYSVARDIIAPKATPAISAQKFGLKNPDVDKVRPATSSFGTTQIQPLSASMGQALQPGPTSSDSLLPPSSLWLGLDLDLTEIPARSDISRQGIKPTPRFFEPGDKHGSLALPVIPLVVGAPVSNSSVADNLIDFDLIHSSVDPVDKRKPP